MVARSAGFTLIETIIALVLSSIVIMLVSTTFLVQTQYYSAQTLRAQAHDNARTATERMAGELRSVMDEGFVVAGRRTLTVRSPVRLFAVCDVTSTNVYVHNEGGETGLYNAEIAGVAWLNQSTGDWDYRTATWAYMDGTTGTPAPSCAVSGADTTWATGEFHRVRRLGLLYGTFPIEGDILMLYRETTFKIQTSVLEPGTLGLFRGTYGQPLVELATGMDSTAQFQYRTGGTTYADTITSANLSSIDAVRFVADARKRAESGGQRDVTYGWSVNMVLRNVP
ncbi:MAG: prepilin-type N-terminal cleavage/methylation domain-containing protein [Longimicrobiales bacterium]